MKTTNVPRGIRNNNPLNIRIGNVWLGEVPNPTDPDFEQFVSLVYGLRAGFVLLRRYIRHYKRTTIPAIIAAWAPATENDTRSYVSSVCRNTNIAADDTLDFFDKVTMCRLVSAMAVHECGQIIPMDTIERAYDMA